VRLLLTLPLGLLIGVALGALGGGGSILAVPALVYVVGLEPKPAVTTSLVIVGVTALGGMVGHLRAGRVRVGAGLWFGLAGVAGSLLGSRLNRAVDPKVLLVAFSGVMMIAAWRMWASARGRDRVLAKAPVTTPGSVAMAEPGTPETSLPTLMTPTRVTSRRDLRHTVSLVAGVSVAGTVVGFMTGFFGVGGGFVIVPALVLALRFDMPIAVGTSLLVIAINSGTALVTRLATTGVDWRVAVPFTIAGLVGALTGNHLASRAPSSTLIRWFVALLVAVAVYTLARSVG
jgi:uncharacterized membrane protein YfcA